MSDSGMTLEDFFAGHDASRRIFDVLHRMVDAIGPAELRVTKSQVAFRRHRSFASAWMPSMYLRGERPPLVLTVALRYRDASPRWKQVVEPAPGRFTHHLEIGSPGDLDDEVRAWLQAAWEGADKAAVHAVSTQSASNKEG